MDAILTDVTRTWLDLRSALHGMSDVSRMRLLLTAPAVDYDKIAAQHSRLFLWTTWYYYSPVQRIFGRAKKAALESVAGPFKVAAV